MNLACNSIFYRQHLKTQACIAFPQTEDAHKYCFIIMTLSVIRILNMLEQQMDISRKIYIRDFPQNGHQYI